MSTTAKTKRGLLANAFQSSKWNSRITTANVGAKEMWLGYVLLVTLLIVWANHVGNEHIGFVGFLVFV